MFGAQPVEGGARIITGQGRARKPCAAMGGASAARPLMRRDRRISATLDDAAVVALAQEGHPAAWEELVRRFEGLVAATARRHRLAPCDGADVAQMTWLQLHRHIHRLTRPESVGGWISRTARNECLRLLDRKAREVPVDLTTTAGDGCSVGDDPLVAALAKEREATVQRVVATLPDRSQELLELLFWQQVSYYDVTDALGMPRGSIGPVRGRCLRRLAHSSELAALA